MAAILKMAAIFFTGRIWDGPISKNHHWGIVYLSTKFHACFIKPTILANISPICSSNQCSHRLVGYAKRNKLWCESTTNPVPVLRIAASHGFSKLTKNVIRSSHGHSAPSLKISCKSVQPFSRNLPNKETKKERYIHTNKEIDRKQYPVPRMG